MAFKKDGTDEFKYVMRNARIIEEKGNQFIRFSEIAFGTNGKDEDGNPEEIPEEKFKYDIRKWTNDAENNEKMLKGVQFLSKDGPHELCHVLVEEGFGNTEKILNGIKVRDDFPDAVRASYGEKAANADDETFDLRDLL